MHLRLLTTGGYTYRIVTLRPGTGIVFSANYFHQTWHIVTSQLGARMLARLLWAISFERHPGTLLLIHGGNLAPTPFEAERSDPFLIVPAGLTHLDSSAFRILKGRLLRLGPPTKTIRWQTFGLDLALKQQDSRPHSDGEHLYWKRNQHFWKQERMERIGGFICYSAPAAILREQALMIHRLRVRKGHLTTEMDYHFLAYSSNKGSWYGDGEVQIFADYMDRVASANEARQELVANPKQPILSETIQEVISRRRDQIKARRRRRRRIVRGRQRRKESLVE